MVDVDSSEQTIGLFVVFGIPKRFITCRWVRIESNLTGAKTKHGRNLKIKCGTGSQQIYWWFPNFVLFVF